MSKAVFLDRDGVVTEDIGYVHKVEDFKLMPNAVEGLGLLKNFKLFFVTNQSGIGRGYYKFEDFLNYNNRVVEELKKHNVKIEKTYVCPHKPDDSCECRKPKTKLLKDAEKEFGLTLKECFVVGDKEIDIEMGKNAGCTAILVKNTPHQSAERVFEHARKSQQSHNGICDFRHVNGKPDKIKPDYAAKDLVDAAWWILECQH